MGSEKIEILERALSVRQPFANRILIGEKPIEYRSRRTHIRGRVYIYAGKNTIDFEHAEDLQLPRGMIVGSVEIYDCLEKRDEYHWMLRAPFTYAKPWKPIGQPQPGFWRPKL